MRMLQSCLGGRTVKFMGETHHMLAQGAGVLSQGDPHQQPECWQQRRGLAPEQQSSWLYDIWELIKD